MARIRTIKPEFPQSESMGRVSRDARLLFVQLWTICDDEGRCRGAPRMLSSLLFPYDDDAPGLIDGWLEELERENCIVRYCSTDGASLIQLSNWLLHQKIDKPTPSKFPAPDGSLKSRYSERDIEDRMFNHVAETRVLFGYEVIDLQRQVRVGSSYLDIVVTTREGVFVLELKRDRLTAGDVRQVMRYAELTGAIPVLVGAGMSPMFPIKECISNGIAVLGFDPDGGVALLLESESVKECSITFASATESSSVDRGPWTVDRGPGSGPRTIPPPPYADAPGGAPPSDARDEAPAGNASPSAPPDKGPSSKESRGTRLPKPWVLPQPWGNWALAEYRVLTADRVRKIAEQFRDYWHGRAGAAARKADWEATWRNWVRNEMGNISGAPPPRGYPQLNGRDAGILSAARTIFGTGIEAHGTPERRGNVIDADSAAAGALGAPNLR